MPLAAGLAAGILLAACTGPERPVLTDAQLQERGAQDAERMAATFRDVIGRVLVRAERDAQSGGTLDVLAISGGGDYGAFGAGFLVGWGSVTDPQWRRPDFDAVTGVSTGALLAPFAFVGTDESCREVEQFYRNPKFDWVQSRWPLYFLPSNPSFMQIRGLERDVRAAVNEGFIRQVAAESRKGKVLAVSATDLDLGRQKLWALGLEAERATTKEGVDRVQRILLASAAVPAIFPPVEIDDSAYADGGVTANVLLRLEVENPDAFLPRWKEAHPDTPVPKIRYWIIFNNQMRQPPKTVQIKWPAVVSPSLATAVRSATLAEVRWLAAQADYVNAVYGTNIEVRVVSIPDEWRAPVQGDFKRPTMISLSDLGRKMGADPRSWQLWASPGRTPPPPPPPAPLRARSDPAAPGPDLPGAGAVRPAPFPVASPSTGGGSP